MTNKRNFDYPPSVKKHQKHKKAQPKSERSELPKCAKAHETAKKDTFLKQQLNGQHKLKLQLTLF